MLRAAEDLVKLLDRQQRSEEIIATLTSTCAGLSGWKERREKGDTGRFERIGSPYRTIRCQPNAIRLTLSRLGVLCGIDRVARPRPRGFASITPKKATRPKKRGRRIQTKPVFIAGRAL